MTTATTKATQYAEATGQHLGEVVTLHEVKATPLPTATYAYRAAASLDALKGGAVPIQAGSEKLSVQVSVVWELR